MKIIKQYKYGFYAKNINRLFAVTGLSPEKLNYLWGYFVNAPSANKADREASGSWEICDSDDFIVSHGIHYPSKETRFNWSLADIIGFDVDSLEAVIKIFGKTRKRQLLKAVR